MLIAKGVEIIPKRDKVTYATNLSGKWEDYSIDTHEGKVLKDAVDRFKKMLKEGKDLSLELLSLKQQFNQHPVSDKSEMKRVNFWDDTTPVTCSQVPHIEMEKVEQPKLNEDKSLNDPLLEVVESTKEVIPESVADVIDDDTSEGEYIVTAYVNKSTGRQMYLTSLDGTLRWAISSVPYVMSKDKSEKLIKKAVKEIELYRADSMWCRKYPNDIKFEIVEYIDPYSKQLTYEDIVARANQMIEENRKKKQQRQ